MENKILYLSPIILIVLVASGSAEEEISILSSKMYPNTYAKDMDIDAPWFIASELTRIPVQFFIKDANVIDLEELEGLYLEVPRSRVGRNFSSTDTIFRKVYSPVIEDLDVAFWDTIIFIPVPEGYTSGQTIFIRATIDFEDGLFWDEYFSKVLAVKIGRDREGFPKFEGWYQGDCHFHTSFTNNAYEFGGTFRMIAECARAMGVDFVTMTDHASDSSTIFGFLADDLNLSDWLTIPESIAIYGSSNPIIIRGEEADIRSGGSGRNHLLIYGADNFFSAKIDYSIAAKTHSDARAFLLDSPEAVAYPAHPFNPDYLWNYAVFDTGFEVGVYSGLQIWNERTVWETDVDLDEYCDPFPFSSGTMARGGLWDADLINGIAFWDSFLIAGLPSSEGENPRKAFITGGSDAHGDFNYFTFYPFVGGIPIPDIYATDNAFAKVRTLVYCPEGPDQSSILSSIRNGSCVATDGPIVKFGLSKPSGVSIVGQTDTVYCGGNDSLVIDYLASTDFGGAIRRLTLTKLFEDGIEEIALEEFVSGLTGSFHFPLEPPIEEGWCCYRLTAATFFEGQQYTQPESSFRCFTNPIWFYVVPNSLLAISEKDLPDRLFLKIFPNPFNSSCKIESNSDAKIEIFDAIGQKLAELSNGKKIWRPKRTNKSGVYLIRAQRGNRHLVRRAIYIK